MGGSTRTCQYVDVAACERRDHGAGDLRNSGRHLWIESVRGKYASEENRDSKNSHGGTIPYLRFASAAYAIGSSTPACSKARRRRAQLSQVPQARSLLR